MSTILGIPIILVVVMLQTVVISSLPLLQGTCDLVLLVVAAWSLQERVHSNFTWAVIAGLLVGFVSKVPWAIPLIGYLVVSLVAQFLRRQVWQTPVLAMFITTLTGSILLPGLQWVTLQVLGVSLPLADSINLIVLPATFLNLLFALPVYALVTDFTQSVFPEEVVT
jgi:rod shape-determining protein MreD